MIRSERQWADSLPPDTNDKWNWEISGDAVPPPAPRSCSLRFGAQRDIGELVHHIMISEPTLLDYAELLGQCAPTPVSTGQVPPKTLESTAIRRRSRA